MTDQTKIPLPQDGEQPVEVPGASLIERAVESFGWGKLSPPPLDIKPIVRPEPVRYQSEPAPEIVEPEPDFMPAAIEPDPVVVELEPEVIEPEPVAIAPEPVAEIVPAPAAEPSPIAAGGPHRVDREHLRRQGFIVPEGNVTATLEEFRIVKRQLLLNAAELKRQGGDAKAQRVLICSPHPGEGKTYCAVNLALSIAAEKESEVLLVDADFAKPSVLSALGLPGGRGLMDALADPSLDVTELVLATDVPGLKVLPAGDATTSDSEYLSSSRTATVLDRLTQGAPNRIVIFDSPPALAASPAAELAQYVGQALVICRADRTGQQSLEDAISLLSGCPNIQLLLNAANFSPSGRRFGAYYGYGA
ncbi:capsular biosynthesis protein [Novosphingobium sp. G106]|uniref:capsular biosynthesis protein n=1 Tax=Novosphingobium sp. G106 TaxID=2849500 RepID=UPI001C2D07B1|nr:capsular biosynthesis protein [Novosphingobium sp. G106]MBV1687567.1 capsular biosynthesis protein [Novosphingobium sp. G106]